MLAHVSILTPERLPKRAKGQGEGALVTTLARL